MGEGIERIERGTTGGARERNNRRGQGEEGAARNKVTRELQEI